MSEINRTLRKDAEFFFIGYPEQYAYLFGFERLFNRHTRLFLTYLYACTLADRTNREKKTLRPGYIPVPSVFIKKHFRKLERYALVEACFVYQRRYNRAKGECREFKLAGDIVSALDRRAPTTAVDLALTPRVDLYTGQITTRQAKTRTSDENNHAYPAIIIHALRCIGPTPFNARAIETHLNDMDEALSRGDKGITKERLLNDVICYRALFQQRAERLYGDFWQYIPAYVVNRTGRISQIGGGLQGGTRAMKAVAYSGIDGVMNYDLKSSQVLTMIEIMEEEGFGANWLRRYSEHPKGKRAAAEWLGVSEDTWKNILYAVLYGANLPSRKGIYFSRGAIRKALERDAGRNGLEAVYGRVLRLMKGLSKELGLWHDHLLKSYASRRSRKLNITGGVYVTNQVGMKMKIEDNPTWRDKAALSAFLLQGKEAAFIHHLTAESISYGFRVLSNEHDGLVTIGELSEAAITAAAQAACMQNALLVQKSFV